MILNVNKWNNHTNKDNNHTIKYIPMQKKSMDTIFTFIKTILLILAWTITLQIKSPHIINFH